MIQMLLLCACSDTVLNSEEPFTKAHGMNHFEYMQSHPAFMAQFKDGLADISPDILPMLLSKYHGFEGVQKLMDVGGSTAEILVAIKHKYPHIHAVNFDLPQVIASNPSLPGTFNAAYPNQRVSLCGVTQRHNHLFAQEFLLRGSRVNTRELPSLTRFRTIGRSPR